MSLLPRIPPEPKALPFGRPVHSQLAALCWRPVKGAGKDEDGREVLLVTSSTGRWILPKGWPIDNKTAAETALTEAWEEGGVKKGKVSRRPLGNFMALKTTASGDAEPCLLRVFAVRVQKTVDDFPEADQRNRIWVSPQEAAALVDEDGLREILAKF